MSYRRYRKRGKTCLGFGTWKYLRFGFRRW